MAQGLFFVGDNPEERLAQFRRLAYHVETLWDQAVLLYRNGHRATAGFLSIVVFEELSKLAFLRFEVAEAAEAAEAATSMPGFPRVEREGPLPQDLVDMFRKNFNKHRQKQASGMAWAFRINSRVTRLFGEKEAALGQRATAGEMESLRQSLLYIDLTVDGFSVPSERDDELPLTLVALAGEALAEIGSVEASEWSRLLDRVREFEIAEGLPAD